MKIKILLLMIVFSTFIATTKAQFAVVDPAHIATSIVNSINQVVETSTTASNMINNFKETVKIYEQGKEYYDALKRVNVIVKDAVKVQKSILLVGEISDIYINSYQKMISDPNFKLEELSAIAFGYSKLLQESSDMLLELKDVVNANGLSMSDAERLGIIDDVYYQLKRQRDLVNYYTKKNISVSYLRSQKNGDTDRVMSLYGNTNDRYW